MHSPGRHADLRRIQELDPEVDFDEILRLTARYEFPWDYVQGTGIAFMRDYGIPSIAALLDRTREFEDHGTKRYDDTILIGEEATARGDRLPALARRTAPAQPDPRPLRHPERRARVRPRHHDRRPGALDLLLRLAPARPARAGRRGQGDHPLRRADGHHGPAHDVRRLPALLVDHERRHFAHTPAATRLAEASIRIARELAPPPLRPLVRRVTIAVMDEPLREALGMPRQPRWFVRAVHGGLRLRGRLLRLAPPRRAAYTHRPTSYPTGYTLADLGPVDMLDHLNRNPNKNPDKNPDRKQPHA